jgi:EAL and modified HD-GYP domain-containing signal transduction protein
MPDVFISRQPLVNRQSKIIATRLTLHLGGKFSTRDAAQTLSALSEVWPEGEKLVFINCGETPCDAELLNWAVPANATIELDSSPFAGDGKDDFVAALQAQQPSLCLDFDAQAAQAILSHLTQKRFLHRNSRYWQPRRSLTELALPSMSNPHRRSRPVSTPA